jgi:hypothetical protein
MAHFSCGSLGERNGNNLARIFYFTKQSQEAAGQKVGLSRASRRLN